jgi:hypothetical protein
MSLDLNNMVNTSVNVITKPSAASFESTKGSVNTIGTIAALAAAGAVNGFLGPLAGLRMGLDNPLTLVLGMCGGFIFGAILFPIFFYIGMAILWVIAKVLGGTGALEM